MTKETKAKRNQYAFDKAAYDHLHVQVAKGKKAVIQRHVEEMSMTSINAYINDLIRADIGMDETEWKRRETSSDDTDDTVE